MMSKHHDLPIPVYFACLIIPKIPLLLCLFAHSTSILSSAILLCFYLSFTLFLFTSLYICVGKGTYFYLSRINHPLWIFWIL